MSASRERGSPDTPGQKGPRPAVQRHLHTIDLDELIIHRYADHDALLKKAHKVARELIESELRDGEGVRVVRPGVYQLFFPKLKPEAGALRCSVIAERLSREIRNINPASAAIEEATQSRSEPRRGVEPAHHDGGTRALARMASAPDIGLTEQDRAVLDALRMSYRPVWHTKNNLITGYYCDLGKEDGALNLQDLALSLGQTSSETVAAKIDTVTYRHAAQAVEYLLREGLKALLIVPVHFSTIGRLRFLGSLLESGQELSEDAKNLVVFEIKGLPRDMSVFRLREAVSYLRPRARALLAQTGFEAPDLTMYKELGFHGVSLDLAAYEWTEPRLLKGFERFVEGAEGQKLQSFVHGISTKSLVVGAIAAGVRYMDGNAVSEPVGNPQHIQPYEIDMLYSG